MARHCFFLHLSQTLHEDLSFCVYVCMIVIRPQKAFVGDFAKASVPYSARQILEILASALNLVLKGDQVKQVDSEIMVFFLVIIFIWYPLFNH